MPASMGDLEAPPDGSRIYGPRSFEDKFLMYVGEDKIRPVLAKIDKIYSRVKLDKESLHHGLCFGLLDPASNIVVNSVISKSAAAAAPDQQRSEGGEKAGDMNQRSLVGLVAFLTYLFPYLPDAEAITYLGAADADPLVAALIIIDRRGMQAFDFAGATVAAVETALRCAAVAARHPDPQLLVQGWKLLSPGLKSLAAELSRSRTTPDAVVRRVLTASANVTGTPGPYLQLEQSWEVASSRRPSKLIPKALPPVRAAMKRMLLATIHGFYLKALGRLPTAELRDRYHRSMLMGGYSYGPLDPVSNIIVNTIWYEQNFPMTSKQVTLQMISTESLRRVAARSLYGLVSFLCTRYSGLTPDLALQRLLAAEANLQVADPNLFDMPNAARRHVCLPAALCYRGWFEGSTPSSSVAEAYAAAATAAFHPDPLAQKDLLGSLDSVSRLRTASEMLPRGGGPLSSMDLVLLSKILLQCPSSVQPEEVPKKVNKGFYSRISRDNRRFWDRHERAYSKVKAALDVYNKDRVPQFRLHVICGVNEFVSGPEFSTDREVKGYNPWTPFKYHHCHINFLATCDYFQSADDGASLPVLFFAECSNHGIDKESWCAPVVPTHPYAGQVRCIYCEHEGSRIVHPATKSFHGRDIEFEMVLRGEPFFRGTEVEHYTNYHIIENKSLDWVHSLEDDAIYSIDYADDADEEDYWLVEIC